MLNPKVLFRWHSNSYKIATRFDLVKHIRGYAHRHNRVVVWLEEFDKKYAELAGVSEHHKKTRAAELRRPDNTSAQTARLDAEKRYRTTENEIYELCFDSEMLFEDRCEDNSHWQHKPQTSPKEQKPAAQPFGLLDSPAENKI